MEMRQELDPMFLIEQRMDQIKQELDDVKDDVTDAVKFIKGNGDPTKGLLWIVADLTRLLATNTQLIDTQRQALERYRLESDQRFAEHLTVAHKKERNAFWENVKDSATK